MLGNIFSFDPLSGLGTLEVVWAYIVYFGIGFLCTIPILMLHVKIFGVSKKIIEVGPVEGALIGVGEELVFRGVPLIFAPAFFFPAHIVWSLLHIKPYRMVFAGVFGILFARLWIGGMWQVAIILHAVHNFVVLTFGLYQIDKYMEERGGRRQG